MSLFDKLFQKNATVDPACEPLTVYAPVKGNMIPLTEFPDPVFSEGILGKGCGIEPSDGKIYAPCDGVITTCPKSGHAVGLESSDGMDTVEMKGKGFRVAVEKEQSVKKGQLLITFDRAAIKAADHPDTIAVVVANSDELGKFVCAELGKLDIGSAIYHFE